MVWHESVLFQEDKSAPRGLLRCTVPTTAPCPRGRRSAPWAESGSPGVARASGVSGCALPLWQPRTAPEGPVRTAGGRPQHRPRWPRRRQGWQEISKNHPTTDQKAFQHKTWMHSCSLSSELVTYWLKITLENRDKSSPDHTFLVSLLGTICVPMELLLRNGFRLNTQFLESYFWEVVLPWTGLQPASHLGVHFATNLWEEFCRK